MIRFKMKTAKSTTKRKRLRSACFYCGLEMFDQNLSDHCLNIHKKPKRVKNQQLLSFSLAASVSQEDDMHRGTSGEDFEPERANLDAPTSSVHQEDIPSYG